MDNSDQYAGAGEVEVLFVAHTCNKIIAEQMAETIARMAQQRGMRLGKPFYYGYDERADPKANMEHLFPNIKEYQVFSSFSQRSHTKFRSLENYRRAYLSCTWIASRTSLTGS